MSVASLELRGKGRALRWRPFVVLGEWSFAFYLIHATAIYAALNLWGTQPGGWIGVLWVCGLLVVSLTAAWVLHAFFEAPVERYLRRWQNRRRELRKAPADEAPSQPGNSRSA